MCIPLASGMSVEGEDELELLDEDEEELELDELEDELDEEELPEFTP